jgi:hypothetical protein
VYLGLICKKKSHEVPLALLSLCKNQATQRLCVVGETILNHSIGSCDRGRLIEYANGDTTE